MTTSLASLLGKYRDLVLAIAIFLFIDASVSGINIYTSHQIEADAGRINNAGLLRTYSQQLTKALLTLDMDLRLGLLTQTSLAEISEARLGFDDARRALESQLTDKPGLPFVESEDLRQEARANLQQVLQTWEPIEREVSLLLLNADLDLNTANAAISKAVTRNNRLTQQANALSDSLEAMARQKAASLRWIQSLAISLAFINFLFIIVKFIGRLVNSDRQTAAAREETGRILSSVREGLFLLTRQRTIGQQRSASLDRLFGEPLPAGADFHTFLAAIVSPDNAETAREYIDLLFNRKMKQSLLKQLNPLVEIELLAERRQKKGPSHLSFEFSQVRENDEVVALLVTVSDVSQQVRLSRELAGAEARAEDEVKRLLGMLDHDPETIGKLLARARNTLRLINGELQNIQPRQQSYPALVNHIASTIHGLKGEAATLGCSGLARAAHAFEDVLLPLRQRQDLSGNDLIPLAVGLNDLLGEIDKAESIIDRLRQLTERHPRPPADALNAGLAQLAKLAHAIAADLDKAIQVEYSAPPLAELPPQLDLLLREAAPQLIRNAVAHGIELPAERQRLGKPERGLIRLEITDDTAGNLTLAVQDDGCGLAPERIRKLLAERALRTPEQLAAMNDEAVLAVLFEPGFSSLETAHAHAGRGDGLAVVKAALGKLGGRLRISSQANAFSRFTLHIKAA